MSGQLKVSEKLISEAFLANHRDILTASPLAQVKGNIMLATKLDTVLKSAQAQSKA